MKKTNSRRVWPSPTNKSTRFTLREVAGAKIKIPTLKQVEAALGPAKDWFARCFQISSACVECGLVSGAAVYGHWIGEIHPKSRFANCREDPFVRHGWVKLPDGRVFDPTRWTFTAEKPYLFVGVNQGEYDEGGDRWRMKNSSPPPRFSFDEPYFTFSLDRIVEQPWRHVQDLFGDVILEDLENRDVSDLSLSQLHWLANLPFDRLQPHARVIYKAIIDCGQGALIPIDNRQRAEREGYEQTPPTEALVPRTTQRE
jgi:hypothetical protein